jgi:hypothetical protein
VLAPFGSLSVKVAEKCPVAVVVIVAGLVVREIPLKLMDIIEFGSKLSPVTLMVKSVFFFAEMGVMFIDGFVVKVF